SSPVKTSHPAACIQEQACRRSQLSRRTSAAAANAHPRTTAARHASPGTRTWSKKRDCQNHRVTRSARAVGRIGSDEENSAVEHHARPGDTDQSYYYSACCSYSCSCRDYSGSGRRCDSDGPLLGPARCLSNRFARTNLELLFVTRRHSRHEN